MGKGHLLQVIVNIMPSLVVPSCIAGAQFFSKARVHDEKIILDIVRNKRKTLIKKTFFLRFRTKSLIITQNGHMIKYVLS